MTLTVSDCPPRKAISSRTRSASATAPPAPRARRRWRAGWTNATSSPSRPAPRASRRSARRRRAASRSSSAATSSTSNATWCIPGPRRARNLPDRRVGPERGEQLDPAVADPQRAPSRRPGRSTRLAHARARRRTGAGTSRRPRRGRRRRRRGGGSRSRCTRPDATDRAHDRAGRDSPAMRLALLLVAASPCSSPAAAAAGVAREVDTASPTRRADADRRRRCRRPSRTRRACTSSAPGTTGGTSIALDLAARRGQGRRRPHRRSAGYGFDIVRIGDKLYFKGDAKALAALRRRSSAAQLLAGKWFVGPGERRAASARSRRSPTSTKLIEPDPRLARDAREGRRDDDRRPAGDRAHRHEERRHALRRDHRARLPARARGRQEQRHGHDHVHRRGTSR